MGKEVIRYSLVKFLLMVGIYKIQGSARFSLEDGVFLLCEHGLYF